jgi:hypothetical protein
MSTYDDFFKIKTLQKEMKGKHINTTCEFISFQTLQAIEQG